MTGKKLSVISGGNQQTPAIWSSTKAFDEFEGTAKYLGDIYTALRKVVNADNHSASTEEGLKRVTDHLGYLAMMGGYSNSIAECNQFLQPYEYAFDNDDLYYAEVAKKVAQLVGCYANANVGDPEVFIRTLIDEAAGTEQSLIAIEAAFRKLRRTKKLLPAISEVLDAIDEQAKAWSPRFAAIWVGFEQVKTQLETKRTELEQKLATEKERKRLAQEAAERNRLAFPAGAEVVAKNFGLGLIERHNGEWIAVGRKHARSIQAKPDTLTLVKLIDEPPRIGQRIYHLKCGWGVIEESDGYFNVVVRAESDGRRYDELFVLAMYVETE